MVYITHKKNGGQLKATIHIFNLGQYALPNLIYQLILVPEHQGIVERIDQYNAVRFNGPA